MKIMQSCMSSSISLTGEISAVSIGQMPDSVRLQFRERNQISVDGVALPGSIVFDEVFLELL